MLLSLHIENYALIRSMDVFFDPKFTGVTGETGAGKSILLGALSLVIGQRADSALLQDKEKKCFVEAKFEIERLGLYPFFEKYDLDYAPHTLLRREINPQGKSRAFINDTPVTLPQLKELADQLIDIHSQHQHLLIHNALFRLQIVDHYAGTHALLQEYQQLYRSHEAVEKEAAELSKLQQAMEDRREYLSFLSKELEDAHLQPDEDTKLEEKITEFSNAEKIQKSLYAANQYLSEQEVNVIALLKEVRKSCESVSSCSPALPELTQRIESLLIETEDIAYSLSQIANQGGKDPGDLVLWQERLDQLYALLRKHRVHNVHELLEKQQDINHELLSFENHREQLERLEARQEELWQGVLEKAARLEEQRNSAIPALQQEILSKLQALGIQEALFHIRMDKLPRPGETGIDKAGFFFSANKGIPEEEIGKIASGGELSRVMLAIKSVLTESALLPTVVFDEIDTGISGDVAGKVGNMMVQLAANHQLVAITHLPQIAAKANLQYHVYKEVSHDKTHSKIRKLTTEERIGELARMMSGDTVTASARETAKMLMGIAKI